MVDIPGIKSEVDIIQDYSEEIKKNPKVKLYKNDKLGYVSITDSNPGKDYHELKFTSILERVDKLSDRMGLKDLIQLRSSVSIIGDKKIGIKSLNRGKIKESDRVMKRLNANIRQEEMKENLIQKYPTLPEHSKKEAEGGVLHIILQRATEGLYRAHEFDPTDAQVDHFTQQISGKFDETLRSTNNLKSAVLAAEQLADELIRTGQDSNLRPPA